MTADAYRIEVTDHARWRAAERFPWFDTATIEDEVRAALDAGRVSTERRMLGLHSKADPLSLYVWTEDRRRVYAVRHTMTEFVVTTAMKPSGVSASFGGPLKDDDRRTA